MLFDIQLLSLDFNKHEKMYENILEFTPGFYLTVPNPPLPFARILHS